MAQTETRLYETIYNKHFAKLLLHAGEMVEDIHDRQSWLQRTPSCGWHRRYRGSRQPNGHLFRTVTVPTHACIPVVSSKEPLQKVGGRIRAEGSPLYDRITVQ